MDSPASVEHVHHRLEHIYEITKLLASFENVEQTFDAALAIAARTLALRSAILIEVQEGHARMIVWPSKDHDSEEIRAAKAHVKSAYAYLVGATSSESLGLSEQVGTTVLSPQAKLGLKSAGARPFIVIPLVVRHHAIFGALQLEGTGPLDKTDLVFVNALANQLAIAIDRDRTWRRDIARREDAEGRRVLAEEKGTMSEQKRANAEVLLEKCKVLAIDNRKLYEQAQKAVELREQILEIVSHDLKNPLAMILMTADALAMRGAPDERRKELPQAADRIHRAAERMQRLIEDLLDFASIEAGRLAINARPQDPGALVQETLASFEAVAQAKALRLTADAEPHLPMVYCDYDRILQALSNLVGNATKATAEGGCITLRVEAQGDEIVFAVSDTGPGIGEEDATHLFERYWRSGVAQYKGTGLGLAITRGIVNAHGGRIWVESTLGQGATFFFTLPTIDGTSPESSRRRS